MSCNVVETVMVGAGERGFFAYGRYALLHPDEIAFTAVVEPHDVRRRRFAEAHRIPPERQFRSCDELYARGRIAEAVFNCTLDTMHLESTLPAIELGYAVMLEKPMAHTLEGSVRLAQAAERRGTLLAVGHVLRHTAFFSTVHEIVASGRLGDVVSVEQRENVVYWHMAHSFVRGNWRRSGLESPMILAKCCHDLDLLHWSFGPVGRVSSFGSLIHFRPENAPAGAPERCLDGCPAAAACPFYAPRLYLGDHVGWPVSVISEDTSLEARRAALERGPYGRCVYRCDNDVVDQQIVCLELESGASGALYMHGHSHAEQRTMRYDGTRATLRGRFCKEGGNSVEVHDHVTGAVERLTPGGGSDGHGGGDGGLVHAFVCALRSPDAAPLAGASDALESHLLAFAAEQARRERRVVEMADFRRRALGGA